MRKNIKNESYANVRQYRFASDLKARQFGWRKRHIDATSIRVSLLFPENNCSHVFSHASIYADDGQQTTNSRKFYEINMPTYFQSVHVHKD